MQEAFQQKAYDGSGQVTQQTLVNQWTKDHELVLHQEQPEISGVGHLLKPTPCGRLGLCVCDNAGLRAVRFCKALTNFLKSYVGTKKAQSPEVIAWQNCEYVLHLAFDTGYQRQRQHSDFYLHIGYTNFRTWEMGALSLTVAHINQFEGTIMLKVPDAGLDVRMVLEFAKMNMDTCLPCNLQLLRILSDCEPVLDAFMYPAYLEVKQEGQPICFWNGVRDSDKQQTSKKRKGSTVAAGRRPSHRAKAQRTSAAAGCQSSHGSSGQPSVAGQSMAGEAVEAAASSCAENLESDGNDAESLESDSAAATDTATDSDVDAILAAAAADLEGDDVDSEIETNDDEVEAKTSEEGLDLDALLEEVQLKFQDELQDDAGNVPANLQPEPVPEAQELQLDLEQPEPELLEHERAEVEAQRAELRSTWNVN